MSDYIRVTRACTLSELRPELRRALLEYAQKHDLNNLENDILQCCETKSEKKPGGWFAWLDDKSDQTIYLAAFFTADWLVWARSGDVSGVSVTAAPLLTIQARPLASLFIRDQGLEVSGYLGGSKSMARGYIGLGPEPAAQQFCAGVMQEIDKLKPPKKFPGWMGG
jgi:hypothetical protein